MMINKCVYEGKCCMRTEDQTCTALRKTDFKDGRCHFQKETRKGPNLYDKWKNNHKEEK